jgi:hypothetical protein
MLRGSENSASKCYKDKGHSTKFESQSLNACAARYKPIIQSREVHTWRFYWCTDHWPCLGFSVLHNREMRWDIESAPTPLKHLQFQAQVKDNEWVGVQCIPVELLQELKMSYLEWRYHLLINYMMPWFVKYLSWLHWRRHLPLENSILRAYFVSPVSRLTQAAATKAAFCMCIVIIVLR